MTKMTDRLSDSNIIELAKRSYENKEKSKLPSSIVNLASKGLIYPKSHPFRKGYTEMRYMTAYDEDILTNVSYARENVILDKLLEALILDPIDISSIAICDKEILVINARNMGYGPEYPISLIDPNTNTIVETIMNLDDIKTSDFKLISDDNGEFSYELENSKEIKYRFLLQRDVDKIKESNAISGFLERTITEVNGNRDIESIRTFIKTELTLRESKRLRSFINDNTPEVIKQIEMQSEDGSTFTASFRFNADLFWL
jgi:hypothetical protein